MRELRIAVGEPSGLRSTVWKIWTHGNSIYVQSRMMGSTTKVSLHGGGKAQFSMESEWYGVNRPDQPNQRRHMQEWRWQNPSGASPEHVFTLSIPFSELREISSAEDLSGVQWLDSPGHGQVVDIQFFVVAHSAAQSASRRHHLATLDLDSQHSLVLLVRRGDITPDVLRELERSRTTLRTEAVEQALRLEPGYRAAILFSYDANGVRGMFELVPEG